MSVGVYHARGEDLRFERLEINVVIRNSSRVQKCTKCQGNSSYTYVFPIWSFTTILVFASD